jgi:hypothetical protein
MENVPVAAMANGGRLPTAALAASAATPLEVDGPTLLSTTIAESSPAMPPPSIRLLRAVMLVRAMLEKYMSVFA